MKSPRPKRQLKPFMLRKKFLVIDDSEFDRSVTARYITRKYPDANIEYAESGDAAEAKDLSVYDYIIVDYCMPGISGIDFIKRNSEKIKAKITLFSAANMAVIRNELERQGLIHVKVYEKQIGIDRTVEGIELE